MKDVKDIAGLAGIHGHLAEVVGSARLSCGQCKRVDHPTREQLAEYFRTGWPKCCGQTMALE